MKKQHFAAIVLTAIFSSAHAQCPNQQKTIFHCATEAQKNIQVCEHNGIFTYSFGKPGNAEIILSSKKDRVKIRDWDGMGRWESYEIGIPTANDDTVYSVFWARDRNSDDAALEAGVRVEKRGKHLATVQCSTKWPITQALSSDGQAASASAADQAERAKVDEAELLRRFADKCEALLPFDLVNKIDERMYFGNTYWSGQSFNGPAVVIYQAGQTLPTSAGRRMIFAPSKLGETRVKLQAGGEVTAKVYGAGDRECAALAASIKQLHQQK